MRGAAFPKDTATTVAEYLQERITPEDAIYVVDFEPVLYYLLDAKRPTRHVFPPHLITPEFQQIDRIDALTELGSIMRQQPKYVIRTTPPSPEFENENYKAALDDYLRRSYALETSISGIDTFHRTPITVDLYRLKPPQ